MKARTAFDKVTRGNAGELAAFSEAIDLFCRFLGSVAGDLVSQAYLDRTWKEAAAVDEAIGKLTTAEVNAALRKYLKPAEFAYAFAGDFK